MKKLFDMKDELNVRLTDLAKKKGMTKTGMLNLVIEKGLAYFEKKQFANAMQVPYYPQSQEQPSPIAPQPQEENREDPLTILAAL